MKKIYKFFQQQILFIVFFLLLSIVYHSWFRFDIITAGDFWPQFPQQYDEYSFLPYAWNYQLGFGMGGTIVHLLWTHFLYSLPVLIWGKIFMLPFWVVERLGFFLPLIIVGIFCSYKFAKHFFLEKSTIFIAMLVYMLNTYILMIISGGQIGIAFAYFITPLVLIHFMKDIQGKSIVLRNSVGTGILLGLLIACDLRIAYVCLIAVGLYSLFYKVVVRNKNTLQIIFQTSAPVIVAVFLHAFWVLPLFLLNQNPSEIVGKDFTGISAVTYFSFAKFENAFALLHPNWPENIFGKVSFMRPEFLLIPLIGFSVLILIKSSDKQKKIYTLFFSLLAIIGAFLAKGTNYPFEQIYYFLFSHFPGFYMFRDSMKFYVLIAMAYAVLLPYGVVLFQQVLASRVKRKKYLALFVPLGFFVYWMILLIPVFSGQVKGLLQVTALPAEYEILKNELVSDDQFGRTLWIPQRQRFAYFSSVHPAIDGYAFFQTTSSKKIVDMLKDPKTEEKLRTASIQYLIIPQDSEGEIFLEDRKYSDKVRNDYIKEIEKISYLHKQTQYNNSLVFTIDNPYGLVVNKKTQKNIPFDKTSPVSYKISIQENMTTIIFSQTFDSRWELSGENGSIKPTKTKNGLNEYRIQNKGEYMLFYKPQQFVILGLSISGLSLLIALALFYTKKTNNGR